MRLYLTVDPQSILGCESFPRQGRFLGDLLWLKNVRTNALFSSAD